MPAGDVVSSARHPLRWADPYFWRRERRPRRAVTPRRFLLCSTPAQGHVAPLLAIARRLVDDGHDVVFFTTRTTATGRRTSVPDSYPWLPMTMSTI